MNIDDFTIVRLSFEKDKLEKQLAAAMEVVEAVRECFFKPIVYGHEAREEINRRDHRLVEALRKFDLTTSGGSGE